MKRLSVVILVILLISALLVGCGGGKEPAPPVDEPDNGGDVAGNVKTGLAVITELGKSVDAGDDAGLAQTDSTVVAVMVDDNNKVLQCVIEAVQSKINFDASGQITTPLDTMFPSKTELGDDYGMRKASGIAKEWNEQAAAFAEYVTGMSASEVAGIAVDEKTHPTDSDLTASVTMAIGDLQAALEKATK